MIYIERASSGKRKWNLYDSDKGEDPVFEMNLENSSITNKFEIVKEVIDFSNENIDGFEDWFRIMISGYIKNYDSEKVLKKMNRITEFANAYVQKSGVNFSNFVNIKKSSKTSILFSAEEIEAINKAAYSLKIYSIFYNDLKLKLADNIHKEIYEIIIKECSDLNITNKIYELVRSKIYRSSVTDKYMWVIIGLLINETPDSFSMNVFNSLMINFIPLINININPIVFLVTIIDDGIRWLMKNSFKEKFVYGDSYGVTSEVTSNVMNRESFNYYCHKDTIIKISKVAIDYLDEHNIINENNSINFYTKLNNLSELSISQKLINLPLISKILYIPYKVLLTFSPKHIILISIFLYYIAGDNVFKNYSILRDYLISVPNEDSYISSWSTYKLKKLDNIINDPQPIFGFSSPSLKFNILSPICGVLSSNRKSLVNIIDDTILNKHPFIDVETEVIDYFTKIYSNSMDEELGKVREIIYGLL